MKRFLALVLMLAIICTLCACGKKEEAAAEGTTAPVVTTTPTETTVPEETTLPEETTAPVETTAPEETTAPVETTVPEETTAPEETDPAPTQAPTKPQSSNNTSTHKHKYSKATCTTPAKCSCGTTKGKALGHSWKAATCTAAKKCSTCGKTEGKALGHNWQAATCKAAKTCKTCKKTEGGKGSHTYSSGKCTVCGAADVLNPKTSLKFEEEYVAKVYFDYGDGDCIYAPGFQFYNDGGYGDGDYYCIVMDAMFTSNPDPEDSDIKQRPPVTYQGKKYYRCGAGQSPAVVELTDTEIIVTKEDSSTVKLTMLGNGNLKVTASTMSKYPVNTELSISWSMLR